jgi:hypothetical protein
MTEDDEPMETIRLWPSGAWYRYGNVKRIWKGRDTDIIEIEVPLNSTNEEVDLILKILGY